MSNQVEAQEETKTKLTTSKEDFKDLLDRKKLAKNFVSVLTSQDANVFSINGGWGTGKTWFLKFIEEECETNKIPFVQYNVWETDYLNDPFRAVTSELTGLLDELIDKKMETNPQLKALKTEINSIKSKAEEIITKCTFSAQVTTPSLGGTVPTISTGVQYNPSKISDYEALKTLKLEFDEKLKNIIRDINVQQIIIAIDELDRCRPDYAIRTLEVIKHFFKIDGIKFILAVDKQQLANTVKALYGQDANTDCYLRKFVDIEYNLPAPNNKIFSQYLMANKYPNINAVYSSFLREKKVLYLGTSNDYDQESQNVYEIEMWSHNCSNQDGLKFISNAIYNVIELSNLKLRDMEKIFLKLSIILNKFSLPNDILNLEFLLQLLIINSKAPALYDKLKQFKEYESIRKEEKKYLTTPSIEQIIKMLYLKQENKELILTGILTPRQEWEEVPDEKHDLYFNAAKLYKYFDKIDLIEGFE